MRQEYRPPNADEAELAINLTVFVMGLEMEDVAGGKRGSDSAARARQVAMYLMYVTSGLSLAKVALAFGRDRSTVSHACHQVEDRRDDPDFDRWIEQLETVIERLYGLREQIRVGREA